MWRRSLNAITFPLRCAAPLCGTKFTVPVESYTESRTFAFLENILFPQKGRLKRESTLENSVFFNMIIVRIMDKHSRISSHVPLPKDEP